MIRRPLTASCLALLALTACGSPATEPGSSADTGERQSLEQLTLDELGANPSPSAPALQELIETEGPRADEKRELAAPRVAVEKGVQMSEVDLGNTSLDGFTAPVRGTLALPENPQAGTPLVIINHLRAPGCTGDTFAYPCPDGTREIRYDRGMQYLAADLAADGYAVLIPDLAPAWTGTEITTPYDQAKLWRQTVSHMLDAIAADAQTTGGESSTNYRLTGLNAIDTGTVGLVLHSRSGGLIDTASDLLGDSLKGVLAYGPFYATYDAENVTPPAPADLPYLSITGDEDSDVETIPHLWHTYHIRQERTAPAISVQVEGLGHMYINRALSDGSTDDRHGCGIIDCPDAAAHETLLKDTARTWFGATLHGTPTQELPMTNANNLPNNLGGLPARTLAATTGTDTVHLTPQDFTGDGTSRLCTTAENIEPTAATACPEPVRGVPMSSGVLNHLTRATATTHLTNPAGFALHLMPNGATSPEQTTPVTVAFTFSTGLTWQTHLDPADPALASRMTNDSNGIYLPTTIRGKFPPELGALTITGVTITAGDGTATANPVLLRGLDIYPR